MSSVRVAIVGVGNCASSLVQGVEIPQWSGVHDALGIYTRAADRPHRRRSRRRLLRPGRHARPEGGTAPSPT